ncbi:hydrolase [Halioxenophilus sp. WMMB6]|uniref:hydrolase n=1 Tax=Halioxenophilus sp. WMMB6 TaxID=3073815 RepID=UPI00295EE643|nr:hydrolase [Halioxenophilus sp. WMMB6]
MTVTADPRLALIDRAADALLERLLAWSAINSGSSNLPGLARMAKEISSLFTPLAEQSQTIALANVERLADDGQLLSLPQAPLLTFATRPQAPVQVLLVGHMDTVFPADSPFQTPHFTQRNILQGPGVADMKGGLLAMYQALAAWEQHPKAKQLGWRVVINPDEETGSLASGPLLAEFAGQAHLGMVYEPALADGTLASERKGSGNFSLRASGRSAHAGREFALGRNAIAALAEALVALHGLNRQAAAGYPGVTVNLGRIQGGGPVNVVPDNAVAHFNVRVADHAEQQWLQEQITAIVQQINQQEGITLELFGGFTRPAKASSAAHRLLCDWLADCGATLQVPVTFKATGGCCDGNNLAAAGLANIDTLGVRGGQIHTHQEFMLVDSLTERAKLSYLLLQRAAADGEQLKQLLTPPQAIALP